MSQWHILFYHLSMENYQSKLRLLGFKNVETLHNVVNPSFKQRACGYSPSFAHWITCKTG